MWKYALHIMMLMIVFSMLMGPQIVRAAENADLENRIQQLEQQLGELKTMLEEQKKAEAEKPAPPAEEKPVTKLIGPGGTLRVGGDIRWRGLYFDNLWDFNSRNDGDQRKVFRFRPRVFFDWNPNESMEAYVRFTKEWFYGQDEEAAGYDVEAKDAMFDNAWAEWKNMWDTGLTLRVGRQDLVYGEGFILLDGTPWDGSQTISFDAAKLTYTHDWGTSDLIYSKLVEGDFQNVDDEDLYGLYNKLKWNDVALEPYLLFRNKNMKALDGVKLARINNLFAGGTPITYIDSFDPSPAEETLLLGMRTSYGFEVSDGVKLTLTAEGGKEWGQVNFSSMDALPPALQFSRRAGSGKVDRDAWGGLAHAVLAFNDVAWKPSVKGGIYYMSGDDPTTEDYEGWDDFYAQWPKYSELYVYTLYDGFKSRSGGNDPDVGVWSNMYIPEAMITVKPTDRLTQSLRYLFYGAEEGVGPGGGKDRGHNLQWLTEYVFTKNLTGHFLFEWFEPGNFYADDADDAFFTRFQLMYTF
jgi:hypothetical protein